MKHQSQHKSPRKQVLKKPHLHLDKYYRDLIAATFKMIAILARWTGIIDDPLIHENKDFCRSSSEKL